MIEWRNLKKLHQAQAIRIEHLVAENKALKVRIVELENENATLRSEFTDIKYQLSELQTMLFKKKRTARDTLHDDDDEETPPKAPRTSSSYQRPIPREDEVTKTIHHRFSQKHTGTRTRMYFVEDVPLGIPKTVEKHTVEQWYDSTRRVWVSAAPLPSATVILGDNVRVLVATLITIERLSFDQVRTLLMMLFKLSVSDGEIAKILQREAATLKPAENVLLTSIQNEESHHMDESRYDVRGETRYVWGITGGTSGDSVYRVGVSRGKGVAEKLRGLSAGVLVSDDYGAYRVLATHHQLCFAHLIRKFRDLAQHDGFTDTEQEAVRCTYRGIKDVYHGVVSACSDPDPQTYREMLTTQFTSVATVHDSDPKPVARLKTTLQKNIPYYLTCLSFPSIALTNNLAERALRHVVLKRKNSFGCKSDNGAHVLGTLLSVLLSLYRKDPLTYLEKYGMLRRV